MPLSHKLLILAFIFPILFLLGITGVNEYFLRINQSQTLTFPIEGYDPRDLWAGYYLRYKVNYGLKCPSTHTAEYGKCPNKAYICFEPEKYLRVSEAPDKNCSLFIKGKCACFSDNFRVKGINRYYVPEKKAKQLEQLFIKADKKEIILSVTNKGTVWIKDLTIEGQSIKTLIKE